MFTSLVIFLKPHSFCPKLFVRGTCKKTFSCVQKRPLNRCPKPKWWKSGFTSAFGTYLMVTNTLLSGGMMSLGDLIQQEIEYCTEGKHKDSFDWRRNKNMAIIGFCQGPFMHFFYGALDKYLPDASMKTVSKKIFFDQVVGSPILIASFFMGVDYLDGQKFSDVIKELKRKFLLVYAVDCVIWIPVQFINFFWLSNQFRVMYVNLVVLCYNVFLSYMKFDV